MQQLIKIGEMRSSSMERCNACPGSAILAGGEISKSDEYAREGTAAHTLLEYCLRIEVSPESSIGCLLYTSPSPRDRQKSRMPSSA